MAKVVCRKSSKYIPALEKIDGTESLEGLEGFRNDWIFAARTLEMKQAQDAVVEEMYLKPAIEYAIADGLSLLGQYIYYDALVMHGPGEDFESFGGICRQAIQNYRPPSSGGGEVKYLLSFLNVRSQIMQMEEAHADLSRINAQRKFIDEGKFNLELPLSWTMYGDEFCLKYVKDFY